MLEGAEAVLEPCEFAGFSALKKIRLEKDYRPKELDEKLRFERTRAEAKILHRAKEAKILCPHVFALGKDFIVIEKIGGKTLNRIEKVEMRTFFEAGELLSKLHSLDIVHGDYTTANLMLDGKKLYVIDFGLGFISPDSEGKAVDLLTFVDSVKADEGEEFISGYLKVGNKKIVEKMKEIDSRARYKKREAT